MLSLQHICSPSSEDLQTFQDDCKGVVYRHYITSKEVRVTWPLFVELVAT